MTLQIQKKCRGLHSSQKAKYAHAKFCGYCQDYVEVDADRCVCCFSKVAINSKPHQVWIGHFQKAIDNMGFDLDDWIPLVPESEQPRIRMKIGRRIQLNYYVPLRYFVEFRDLQFQDNKDAYPKFLKRILDTCPRTP